MFRVKGACASHLNSCSLSIGQYYCRNHLARYIACTCLNRKPGLYSIFAVTNGYWVLLTFFIACGVLAQVYLHNLLNCRANGLENLLLCSDDACGCEV